MAEIDKDKLEKLWKKLFQVELQFGADPNIDSLHHSSKDLDRAAANSRGSSSAVPSTTSVEGIPATVSNKLFFKEFPRVKIDGSPPLSSNTQESPPDIASMRELYFKEFPRVEIERPAAKMASPATESPSRVRGLLSFLGKNPEVLGALELGAQGIGQMMQTRAQEKQDRRTDQQQRVNNAIAAFTRQPADRAVGQTATSTGGGVLSALGQALGGYGNVKGAMLETEKDRALETELQRLKNRSNEYVARMNAMGRESDAADDDDTEMTDIQRATAAYDNYWSALGRGEISGPIEGHLDKAPYFGQHLYPTDMATRSLGDATALTLAVAIQGSRPSEGDREAMVILLPRIEDTIELREIKDRNIRRLLAAGQSMRANGVELKKGWTTAIDPTDASYDPAKLSVYEQPIGVAGSVEDDDIRALDPSFSN